MLYANTDDGSSALWVCDGNGVVVDNISYSIGERAPILEQINEHYGTSFTGWSDNEISLRVGDSVPNWNAYEKIEMPQTLVAVAKFNNVGYVIGEIVDNTFICDAMEENRAFSISNDGVVEEVGIGSFSEFYNARVKPLLEAQFEITGYSMNLTSGLVPGSPVPNWDNYIKITS